eukprot:m.9217 g.9217  ORF g.9217 m.9217 type:complete len:63 (-) comp3404_c0_seq1:127-315(-)
MFRVILRRDHCAFCGRMVDYLVLNKEIQDQKDAVGIDASVQSLQENGVGRPNNIKVALYPLV